VNLDDCWQMSRDAQGTIQADPVTFPSGIPALVDYIHSRKLKFGLYSGTKKAIFIYSLITF
jgi:alpha-galactosidase